MWTREHDGESSAIGENLQAGFRAPALLRIRLNPSNVIRRFILRSLILHIIDTENIIGLVPKIVKFPKPRPGRTRRNGVMAAAVTHSLRHAIFAGDYASGDAMLELPLAKKFGVSQAVIRDSLSELAHAGLVRR